MNDVVVVVEDLVMNDVVVDVEDLRHVDGLMMLLLTLKIWSFFSFSGFGYCSLGTRKDITR
jgi:hypothetical protein